MHFALSEEQQIIKDSVERLAADHLAPLAATLDRGEGRAAFLANLKRMADQGLMALNVKADYGGSEAGTIAFALAVEAVAYACASSAVSVSVTNMAAEIIQSQANEELKQKHLPKIADGTYPAASFCLTEAGAGSDPAGMITRARREGDDYVISGEKLYISSAEYAGLFIVWAVSDPERPKGKGISCFLVEAGTPGLIIGKAEEKMGQHGSATNTVIFDNCRVPASHLLGREHDGFRIAVGELAGGRIGVAAAALGIARAAQDAAKAYMKERKQFGKALAEFQGLQWMIADRETELEAARLLVMQAAWRKEQGLPFGREASMAKLYASEAAHRATDTALQIHGGAGYTKAFPVERYARDARITRIYEGTSEIQRLIIAREALA